VTMLLSVFITSCQVSEKRNSGPVRSHPTTKAPASPNAYGRPLPFAV
jgi:hypothetical protein